MHAYDSGPINVLCERSKDREPAAGNRPIKRRDISDGRCGVALARGKGFEDLIPFYGSPHYEQLPYVEIECELTT